MINQVQEDNLLKIFEHFGTKSQHDKFNEEFLEYINAKIDENEECIFEEICDCWILSTQFLLQDEKKAKKIIEYKIKRTIERIKSGYYNKPKF